MQRFFLLSLSSIVFILSAQSQLNWKNVDSLYQPLPPSIHIYFTDSQIDTGKFRAYYLIADLNDRKLDFFADTSRDRRMTPDSFYTKNGHPLVVVNTTFFSFETNRSLNAVIKNGALVAYNIHSVAGRGKDTFTFRHPYTSAIGIRKNRTADIAYLYTDSALRHAYASQIPVKVIRDSVARWKTDAVLAMKMATVSHPRPKDFNLVFTKWKMQTAVGGGPALMRDGRIEITNDTEIRFAGKAIDDKHPRTAMGYTKDGKLIILVVEGRNKNAGGATLNQLARIFKELGAWEALNLDGGGSSCLLVNGKGTIQNSDGKQRAVPAVFVIRKK